MAYSLNLSRSSPFGSLAAVSARRTYAYLIATLNASHPDYDFSAVLRPSDFKRERSLRAVMNNVDSMLSNLRPKPQHIPAGSPIPQSIGQNNNMPQWGPGMWRLIDQQMSLKECSIYRYSPDDFDPFEDDEAGSLWSIHYFFFNREKKRVCYFYLRGVSILAAGNNCETPIRTPVHEKVDDTAPGDWTFVDDDGARKRAKYWFGNTNGVRIKRPETIDLTDGDTRMDEAAPTIELSSSFDAPPRPVVNDNDEYMLSDEEMCSNRSKSFSTVRGFSEEIVGPMELTTTDGL